MIRTLFLCFLSFLSVVLQPLNSALVHAEGVEFVQVPIDVASGCSSVILKGTSRFKGIGFVTPKIFISINSLGDNLFEIIPTGEGTYLIRVALYITTDVKHAQKFRRNDNQYLYTHACDYEQLRVALTQKHSRETPDEDPIDLLAPLPVSSMKIYMNGIKDPVAIGHDDTSQIDYIGVDKVAEFEVKTKAEMQNIISRLTGRIGLELTAELAFEARSTSNYISVDGTKDKKQFQASLKAALNGKTNASAGELTAAVKTAMNAIQMNISQEGNDDKFTQMAVDLVNQFVGVVPPVNNLPLPGHGGLDPGPGGIVPTDTASKGKYLPPEPLEGVMADAPSGDLPTGDPGPISPSSSSPSADAPDRPIPMFSVKAFLKYVEDHKTLNLRYKQLGALEKKIFSTSSLVRADLTDLATTSKIIRSEMPRIPLSYSMAKGQQYIFSLTQYAKGDLLKAPLVIKNEALSKDELLEFFDEAHALMPKLKDLSVRDVMNLKETSDHKAYLEAEKSWKDYLMLWPYNSPYTAEYYLRKIRTTWGKYTFRPRYNPKPAVVPFQMKEKLDQLGIEKYAEDFPFTFYFSKLANDYSVPSLMKNNPAVKIDFDSFTGQLSLTALQDLGLSSVTVNERIPQKAFCSNLFFEDTARMDGQGKKHREVVMSSSCHPIPAYRTAYTLQIEQKNLNGKEMGYHANLHKLGKPDIMQTRRH